MSILSYRDLIVWQKAMDLIVLIYKITDEFPKDELYSLTSQMRRSSISIPSNIAEGKMRGTQKDYRHFLHNAFGSGAELETQIEITKRLSYSSIEKLDKAELLLGEIMKMLNALIGKLQSNT